MKRILLFTVLTFAGAYSFAQGQIGNGDMESWTSAENEPDNWNGFLTASGSWNSFGSDQIQQSTDLRPGSTGSSSCRIFSTSTTIPFVGTVVANGNITLGQINMGSTTPADAANYNHSVIADSDFSEALTDTPDSIVFWAKYTPNGGNGNARMKATLHDDYDYRDPEDATSATHVVATAVVNYPPTNGSWVRFAVPFNYTGPATTNTYILVTFTTNETPGGGDGDDEVIIDDVELIYNPVTNGLEDQENDGIVVSMDNSSNVINFASTSDLNGTYTVFNTLGQAMQSGNVTSKVNFEAVSGIYFVHLNANDKVYSFEILKN